MIRNPAHEQRHRLTVKTLDQVFIMRVKEGLGCSQFEAAALRHRSVIEVGTSSFLDSTVRRASAYQSYDTFSTSSSTVAVS